MWKCKHRAIAWCNETVTNRKICIKYSLKSVYKSRMRGGEGVLALWIYHVEPISQRRKHCSATLQFPSGPPRLCNTHCLSASTHSPTHGYFPSPGSRQVLSQALIRPPLAIRLCLNFPEQEISFKMWPVPVWGWHSFCLLQQTWHPFSTGCLLGQKSSISKVLQIQMCHKSTWTPERQAQHLDLAGTSHKLPPVSTGGISKAHTHAGNQRLLTLLTPALDWFSSLKSPAGLPSCLAAGCKLLLSNKGEKQTPCPYSLENITCILNVVVLTQDHGVE